MTDKPFRASKASGILMLLVMIVAGAIFVYWRTAVEEYPGDYEVRKGNYRLEDGRYDEALAEFNSALDKKPDHLQAHHGVAVTYLQMGDPGKALAEFNETIGIDPSFAVAYADRGVAYDRMGLHEEALQDYRKALELDPELVKGPGWLWRFMRNISEKPPTILERANYIEAELQKPVGERKLRFPEADEKQRMYKK